jgi:uncharacterized protein YndB with AHSA1/START domain
MSENITVSRVIPAPPERIYNAWLDADEHGKMTGSIATSEDDGRFTAWDGYIEGRTLEEVPPAKIVQAWRTTDFPEGAEDSIVTIYFEPVDGGTRVTIQHTNIPDGQGHSYESGWNDHYFDPMTRYFASPASDAGKEIEKEEKGVGEALGHAVEETKEQLEAAAHDALEAVETARKRVRQQAVKAVERVQKKAVGRARAVGKKVKAPLGGKRKKPAAKARKATAKPARKPAKKSARAGTSAAKRTAKKARR